MDATTTDATDEAVPGRDTGIVSDEIETGRVLAALHGDGEVDGDERDEQGAWQRLRIPEQEDRPSDVGALL